MAKNLLIVESPAKTRTLKKFLGRQYAVEASVGHIRDLVKKDMGIGPDYEPRYEVLAAKKDVVKKLRQAAKEAETVYLAPDPDREGEAIAWHIAEVISKDAKDVRRVTFNEITKRAVLSALENPGVIDLKKVDAQQARRVLDRMMGFRLSPLLWEKVKQGLSAGRVQSVALKMVCDRQAEIDVFVPEEYWNLGADLKAAQPPLVSARLHRHRRQEGRGRQRRGRRADRPRPREAGTFTVAKVERKESRQRPAPPFITSRLQQEAARRYGFSVKRTMGLAQGLYEGRDVGDRGSVGLITYMRTDSTRVADEALDGGREYIAATYGGRLPAREAQRLPRPRAGAQDAHEAIRPTSFDLPPDAVQGLPQGRGVEALQADLGPLHRLPDAAGRLRRHPGGHRERPLRPARLRQGAQAPRLPRRLPRDPGRGRRRSRGSRRRAAAAQARARSSSCSRSSPSRSSPNRRRSTARPRWSRRWRRTASAGPRPTPPSSPCSPTATTSSAWKGASGPRPLGRLVNGMLQKGFHDILNEGYTAALEEQLDEIEGGPARMEAGRRRFRREVHQGSRDGRRADAQRQARGYRLWTRTAPSAARAC